MANYSMSSSNDPNRAPRLEFAGVVSFPENDNKKVSVTFDGNEDNAVEIIKTSAFNARVGESCAVLIQGNRMLAIGAISDFTVGEGGGGGGGGTPTYYYSRSLDYTIAKSLEVETDVFRWYNKTGKTLSINKVWASFDDPSTVTFDVNRNGNTIFSSTKLVLNSERSVSKLPASMSQTTLSDGDYLTFDVDSISGFVHDGIISVDLSETTPPSGSGLDYIRSIDYSIGETLVAGADAFRWYNRSGRPLTIDRVWASFAASSTVTFDINKNGTTIFSSTKLVLSSATNAVQTATAFSQTTLADGDYLSIDVDSVSGTPQYGIVSIELHS